MNVTSFMNYPERGNFKWVFHYSLLRHSKLRLMKNTLDWNVIRVWRLQEEIQPEISVIPAQTKRSPNCERQNRRIRRLQILHRRIREQTSDVATRQKWSSGARKIASLWHLWSKVVRKTKLRKTQGDNIDLTSIRMHKLVRFYSIF